MLPFVTAAAMTPEAAWPCHCCPPLPLQQEKEQNLPSGKKEMGKSEEALLFLLPLSRLSPQHGAQGVSVPLHAGALGSSLGKVTGRSQCFKPRVRHKALQNRMPAGLISPKVLYIFTTHPWNGQNITCLFVEQMGAERQTSVPGTTKGLEPSN